MFKKKRNKVSDKTPEEVPEEPPGMEEDRKTMSKTSKYLVAGLGIFIMLAGAGFVSMQAFSGSGSSRQQLMAQKQNSERLREVLNNSQPGPEAGQKQPPKMRPENKPKSKAGNSRTSREAGEFKKKLLKRPSENREALPMRRGSAAPEADAPEASTPEASTPEASTPEASIRMSKVMEKLDLVKKSLEDGLQEISSAVKNLEHGIAANGDRIEALANRVEKVAGSASGMDPEKYARLISQKKELEKRVEELKGKYDWVRHLENKKTKKLKELREKLEKTRKELEKFAQRPVFGEWKVTGLSSMEVVLVNPYTDSIKRLQVGETFKGVKIEKINVGSGIVQTNAGTAEL